MKRIFYFLDFANPATAWVKILNTEGTYYCKVIDGQKASAEKLAIAH